MSKPPKATPHSDIDGVHRDERRNVDTAIDAGQGGEDLAAARKKSIGRPPHVEDGEAENEATTPEEDDGEGL